MITTVPVHRCCWCLCRIFLPSQVVCVRRSRKVPVLQKIHFTVICRIRIRFHQRSLNALQYSLCLQKLCAYEETVSGWNGLLNYKSCRFYSLSSCVLENRFDADPAVLWIRSDLNIKTNHEEFIMNGMSIMSALRCAWRPGRLRYWWCL
jgi:hypothetical protein